MRIYTRTGDKGETSLGGGQRVSKKDCRIEIYGNLDELNSALGLALNFVKSARSKKKIFEVQNHLFNLGAELVGAKKGSYLPLSQKHVDELEKEIDRLSAKLPQLHNFILPGGSVAASHLHLARAFCRRTERSLVEVKSKFKIRNNNLLPFLNRLSDYLFVLTRFENLKAKKKDILWRKK